MTDTPGEDCFPVAYCDGGTILSTIGDSSGQTNPQYMPIQVFIDNDGYVWVAIMSYQMNTLQDTAMPHWVWLYRSKTVLDCEEVKAAGSEGWTPTGVPGWLEYVCDGLAAGNDDTDFGTPSCGASGDPILDVAEPPGELTFYNSRTNCCDLPYDPCNPPPEGACDGEWECLPCVDDLAPLQFAVTLSGYSNNICSDCNDLNGTYICTFYAGDGTNCIFRSENDGSYTCGFAFVEVSISATGGSWGVTVTVYYTSGFDVFTTLYLSEIDCLNLSSEAIPLSLAASGCTPGSHAYVTSL